MTLFKKTDLVLNSAIGSYSYLGNKGRWLVLLVGFILLSSSVTGSNSVFAQSPAYCDGKLATIIGTDGNDILEGSSNDDVIVGLGGSDKIKGKAGNDVLCGGDGNDDISGGLGDDKLFGESGDDLLNGNAGDDFLVGDSAGDKQLENQIGRAHV